MRWMLILIFLAGCTVGPKYIPPEIAMPAEFVENREESACSDEDLCYWWRQFEDPLLDSYIEEAALKNFDVRIALEQIMEARAQYKIQGSSLWPEIDLNAVANRSRYSQNIFTTASSATSFASGREAGVARGSMFGPPVQNFFQIGFDAVWELDFWGRFRRGKQAAFDQWEASNYNAQNVLITVISEVARNYVSIRALQSQIELTQAKIATDEKLLQRMQSLFDAGLDNQLQIDQILAVLESDRAALPSLKSSLQTTIYALAILLGRQPENLAADFEDVKPIPSGIGKVPAGLPSDLLRRRPDIREAERQLAAATEQVGVAISDLFPHISLTGNAYGFESNKLKNWFSHPSSYWTIGPNINWNLINFGRTRGQIDAANAVQRQALLNYEQTVITSLQDVEGALVTYFEQQNRQLYLTQQMAALEESYFLHNDLFQAGLEDEMAALEAFKLVLDSELSLTLSRESLTNDLIALYKALGGSWQCTSSP